MTQAQAQVATVVIVRTPEIKASTYQIYEAMKTSMPFDKILYTTRRLDQSLSEAEATARIDALTQWLAAIPIALNEGRWFQMIETVDVAWHAFILHTIDYAEFCRVFYNGFLHHSPPMSYEDDRSEYAEYTLKILEKEFGSSINPKLLDLKADVKCCYRYIVESGGLAK